MSLGFILICVIAWGIMIAIAAYLIGKDDE